MSSSNSFFSLYLVELVKWNAVGFMGALGCIAEIPFMFISQKLINRFGALKLLALSSAALSLRLAMYAIFPFRPGIIVAQLLNCLCYGLFYPAGVAFISSSVPPERRALGMSIYLSIGNGLPTFLGNILGGFIIDHWGYRTLFGSFAVFPLFTLGIYIFMSYKRKRA
jgi:PPP family 3-phenylpropionic acid transporter